VFITTGHRHLPSIRCIYMDGQSRPTDNAPMECVRSKAVSRSSVRTVATVATAVIVVAAPAPAVAWGAAAHRYSMRRAIDLLPPETQPFYIEHRDEMVMRVNDPDLWRVAGFDDDATTS
jgi:hypothetical protein